MKLLFLDLLPPYIPFLVQCTKGDGNKIDPTVDNLIIYEEAGADDTFDSEQIAGSPFDPDKVNGKAGLWGVLLPKAALTAGKFYIALWEMTVDGVSTAKKEIFFACNAASFKADRETSAVILPVMQGQIYTATAMQNREVKIIQGNTPLLPFSFAGDYSAWSAKFGAKRNISDADYVIDPKDCSLSYDTEKDITSGYVQLSADDTSGHGKLYGEIRLTKDNSILTAIRFRLTVLEKIL